MKQQVMQEAQDEGWAAPNELPDWVRRITISGDLRLRGERDLFGSGNYNEFPNFDAINTSSNGLDLNNLDNVPAPLLNTTEPRTRLRLRARLDVSAQIADWISSDIRIATGNDNGPVSTNQTLGTPGDFSRYAVWFDRAYVQMRPVDWLTVDVGRAPNPFFYTTMLFSDDLNFDGISMQMRHQIFGPVSGFFNLDLFPVFNTDFNFGSTDLVKSSSHDAYLFAAQGGADWKINDNYSSRLGIGYFGFSNVEGSLSAPCISPSAYGGCNTDDTKAPFVQFGNTVFPIRNIVTTSPSGTTPDPQFFGLASGFDILDVHAQLSALNFHPTDIVFDADFVKNLAFNRQSIINKGPMNSLDSNNNFVGGSAGYLIGVTVGQPKLAKKWDWNVSLSYRYIEPDAVLDALNDSDFHQGGTNAKGYVISANLALAPSVWVTARWIGATQVSGPPYEADSAVLRSECQVLTMRRRSLRLAACIAAVVSISSNAWAQDQSVEGRLREVLRRTTVDLRALQDNQATMQAALDQAQKQRDLLQAQVDQLNARLAQAPPVQAAPSQPTPRQAADEQQLRAAIDELKKQNAALQDGLAHWQTAYQQAATLVQTKDQQARQLEGVATSAKQTLGICETKNTKLIGVAQDILHLYQTQSFRSLLLGSYEPLLGMKRVELENIEQDNEDRIRDQQYYHDEMPAAPPRLTPTPTPAAKPAK